MASHQQPPRSHLTLNHLNSQSSTNLFSAGSGSANSHTHIPGTGSSTSSCPTSPSTDMFHRPPALRSTSSSLAPSPRLSSSTPRGSPLLPSASPNLALGAGVPLGSIGAGGYPAEKLSPTPSPLGGLESPLLKHPQHHPQMLQPPPPHQPSICGMPLKYVSYVFSYRSRHYVHLLTIFVFFSPFILLGPLLLVGSQIWLLSTTRLRMTSTANEMK